MEYLSFNQYCKNTFGCKVYKLCLDCGFTCPNRDGSKGVGGCAFCAEGSGSFAQKGNSVSEQLSLAKKLVNNKGAEKYIAYFHAFTNTYAPVERLKSLYYEAVNNEDIVAVSIATRTDCLPDDVINLIGEINKIKPVFVELGLQSIHRKTAEYLNLCYDVKDYDMAVQKLKKIGVNIVVHLILGLPFESKNEMIESVKYAANSGADGIKLQMLHILKGTRLEEEYLSGKFELLTLEEYADLAAECISLLPEGTVIHRITGDPDKKLLVAPQWCADKKKTLNYINKIIKNC